jgi:hypothetical protein
LGELSGDSSRVSADAEGCEEQRVGARLLVEWRWGAQQDAEPEVVEPIALRRCSIPPPPPLPHVDPCVHAAGLEVAAWQSGILVVLQAYDAAAEALTPKQRGQPATYGRVTRGIRANKC